MTQSDKPDGFEPTPPSTVTSADAFSTDAATTTDVVATQKNTPDDEPAHITVWLRAQQAELATTALGGWLIRWAAPIFITLFGAILRFWKLGTPHKLVFDETYYVKDAYSLLKHGVELQWPAMSTADPKFAAGTLNQMSNQGEYVVHPPAGKWMIAIGEWLFGPSSSFAWRFSTAMCGTIAIFILIVVARRLFHSNILGCVAGFFLAIDGEAIVMSRTSLLDNFVMFWALLSFYFILVDRERMKRRLELRVRKVVGYAEDGRPLYAADGLGPGLGMRWFLLLAGITLGLATATKWNGLYFLAVFGVFVVIWDIIDRRNAGVKWWFSGGIFHDGFKAFVILVPTALVTYLLTWTGWFVTNNGYNRQWATQNPANGILKIIPGPLRSLWNYEVQAYRFNVGLTQKHPYQANPLGWLLQWRPTAFDYSSAPTCSAKICSQAVLDIGNPVIWWGAFIALGVVLYQAIRRRDRLAWMVLVGYLAGYVPWLMYMKRTIFTFYSIAFTPWVVLALVYALHILLGRGKAWQGKKVSRRRIRVGYGFVWGICFLAFAMMVFWYPVWTDMSISHSYWFMHMWFNVPKRKFLPYWV